MKADFSRITPGPGRSYLRVLYQQGRVQLDADDNEQAAILLHYLRLLGADLIGPWGGRDPGGTDAGRGPFAVGNVVAADGSVMPRVYALSGGRYWVDGLACELGAPRHSDKPGSLLPELAEGKSWLLYLDVWEREVHWIQDPTIREVALDGADTALRSRVEWRVKRHEVPAGTNPKAAVAKAWEEGLPSWQPKERGRLKVRAGDPPPKPDLCVADPDARYRGLENRFYRVEVHRSGAAGKATFKWSRDNGSVVFRLLRLEGDLAFLENLGRDARSGLAVGDWVEIADDGTEAASGDLIAGETPRPLYRVEEILNRKLAVRLAVPQDVLAGSSGADLPQFDEDEAAERHALVRRWDHREGSAKLGLPSLAGGAAVIQEGTGETGWLTIEDGIQIQFQERPEATYRTGDYWWFAARTATGDVEWPGGRHDPDDLPPAGISHVYAPLAVVTMHAEGVPAITDCRSLFPSASVPLVP